MTDDHYPDTAGYTDDLTSKDAADAIETSGKAPKLREEILELFNQWKWDGPNATIDCENGYLIAKSKYSGTADEIALHLQESILSVRPRVAELHKQGFIERTGERRPSSNGRASAVWRLCNRRCGGYAK